MINEYYAKKFCKEDISKIENYEEHRRKISEARKGKTWKVIDGKRVYFPKEVK